MNAHQSEATWLDMFSWLSMVTPRFVTDPEKLTLALRSCNSLTDSLFSCCLVPSHNRWVLSAFILRRLQLIHALIRSIHEVKRCTVVDADVAGALMYTWVSSAYECAVKLLHWMYLNMWICWQKFYPVNYLRNVALRRANTEHVFLLDIDFLPTPNLHDYSRQLLESAPSIANKLGIAAHNKLVSTTLILHCC